MLASPTSESFLVARQLPEYRSRIVGSVDSLDWRLSEDRVRACRLLEEHASSSEQGPTAPLLIKHAIGHWPALSKWDLQTFEKNYSDQSPLPPSQQVFMPMAEFVSRMQTDCKLPHCVYPEDGEEFYYMQTQLARGMLGDIDLYSPPLSCLGKPGQAGKAGEGSNIQPSGLPVAQIPRVFVSPAGAVSPLHYDTATSFLAQVKGRKRLIFYPPEDLPSLYMHSRWSILRRRAKVDPADPNYAKYPRFKKLGGWQAVLEPGDILWFPGFWSHYTESMDFSVSMTYRFWNQQQAKALHKS